jgi:hypothetical protein
MMHPGLSLRRFPVLSLLTLSGWWTCRTLGQCTVLELQPPGTVEDIGFGFSVATDGEIAAAGAPRDSTRGINAGAVFISRRSGIEWSEPVRLTAGGGMPFDSFGTAVAVHGNHLVVGAPAVDDVASNGGAVYVFEQWSGHWLQRAKITVPTSPDDDEFGLSVALNGDVLVAGARTNPQGARTGSVFVFRRHGTAWIQEAQLRAEDAALGDQFGLSVAVSGNVVVVGARLHDELGINAGCAYVFRRLGLQWTQEAKLLPTTGTTGDEFGIGVAIDGDHVLVGARMADKGIETNAGAAFVFTWDGSQWSQSARLAAVDAAANDQFGVAVGLSGNHAVVGAWQKIIGGRNTGAAYVFERKGSSWFQRAKLTAREPEGHDEFGFSVGAGGSFAMAGIPGDGTHTARHGSANMVGIAGDCNRNGTPDVCDILDGVALDRDLDGIPDNCAQSGDFNSDGVIDLRDFALMQNCFRGPGSLATPSCRICDEEPDDDVDLADYRNYSTKMSGP